MKKDRYTEEATAYIDKVINELNPPGSKVSPRVRRRAIRQAAKWSRKLASREEHKEN
jgi:hypothetical protein